MTTNFIGGYYEKKGSEITKYYFAGATRIAMRKYTIPQNMTVEYMFGDHLGSTSITTDNAGVKVSEMRYKPWGELRYSWTNAPANTSPAYEVVKYQFTGQYSYVTEFGLHYYGARFYDSAVGRFVSADSIIPPGTQGYDRFAYSNNNPVRYIDPSGHFPILPLLVLVVLAFTLGGDSIAPPPSTNYPKNYPSSDPCTSSLSSCFGDTVQLTEDFSSNGKENPVSIGEFEEFADEVAEDLHSHDLGPWPGQIGGREYYDTPFYNGGGRGGGQEVAPGNQLVCIETLRCSGRSDINYMAQGMWGAALGEPLWMSKSIAWFWKITSYWDDPSDDTNFWLEYGYNYYEQWLEEQEEQEMQ